MLSKRQRIEIAHTILSLLSYAHEVDMSPYSDIGIERLQSIQAFSDSFPPHDSSLNFSKQFQTKLKQKKIKMSRVDVNRESATTEPQSEHSRCKYLRTFLYEHWASMRNLFKRQPIDHIREYFGERIATYYSWLGITILYNFSKGIK